MSDADKAKHQEILSSLRRAKNPEEAVGPTVEAVEHLLGHIEKLEKRIAELEKRTANIRSGPGGVTHLG